MATILSIVWYKILPARFGGQKGIALFNEYLSRQHSLVCLCSENNVADNSIHYRVLPELPTSKWQFIDPRSWRKIRRAAVSEKATHIIVEHPYHGIAALRTKKASGAKLVLHSHNIECLRFKEMGRWWWRILYYYERWVHRRADLVLFKTRAEQDYAIDRFGVKADKCMIVPYGIEKKEVREHVAAKRILCERYGIAEDEKILLFAGTLDYAPNAEAVENIYKVLVPLLNKTGVKYKIVVCGRNREKQFQYLNQLSNAAVIMAGEVEEIDGYFAGADVFINPVLSGGGVQTKNIDAVANGCNVVCFESMVDQQVVDAASGKIFVAKYWEGFVREVVKAGEVKLKTGERFFERYYWGNIVRRLSDRISSV